MIPIPLSGRKFSASRKVRLGDVDPAGCFRLDALTRYTQDVSSDDTVDAELDESTAWVVRRTEVHVIRHATLAETLTLTTFCGGLGRRWAERRIQVVGSAGAHYEVASIWIHLDPTTLRPLGLTEQFIALFGEAAGDRTVSASHQLPKSTDAGTRRQWPTRAVDFDTQRHMNNAAYWSVIEQLLADRGRPEQMSAVIEYGRGISLDDDVLLEVASDPADATRVWWHTASGVAATGQIEPG